MNEFETLLMNNPIRAFMQRNIEAPIFRKFAPIPKNSYVLEIGCGSGAGAEIIVKQFKAKRVEAFDLDQKQIEHAKKRVKKEYQDKINFFIGDATKIDFHDNTFDAVFDFGIIHHIPDWDTAISEIARVLKLGGLFFFEEPFKEWFFDNSISGYFFRKTLDHPYQEMPTEKEFEKSLKANRLNLKNYKQFQHYIFSAIGVAEKIK